MTFGFLIWKSSTKSFVIVVIGEKKRTLDDAGDAEHYYFAYYYYVLARVAESKIRISKKSLSLVRWLVLVPDRSET